MNGSSNNSDWAWPALIQSLQHDISHLRTLIDEARHENAAVREAHRKELNAMIEELREVRNAIDPILEEREAAQKARRDMIWGWVGRGGWLIALGVALAIWHYFTSHIKLKVD